MWTIDKSFSFCYGHRVYVQKLNEAYTGDDCKAKCRHLHGHEGLVHVFLESDRLNEQAMVTDFKHLGWLKNFIDDTLDHKFVIDKNDPMFRQLVINVYLKYLSDRIVTKEFALAYQQVSSFMKAMTKTVYIPGTQWPIGQVVNLAGMDATTSEYETLEGYLIVDFVPTSENLAAWMWDIVYRKMKLIDVTVSRIDWFETPKSRATFKPD